MRSNKFNFLVLIPITVVLSLTFSLIFMQRGGCVSSNASKYLSLVNEYAYEYDLKPELVLAVIHAESGFNPKAVSHKGAVGLMQILPTTAVYIAQKVGYSFEIDLNDVNCNLALGCAYLSYLQNRFENEQEYICAYNAGEGTVDRWLKDKKYSTDGKTLNKIAYPETREYLKKVLKYQQKYKKYLTQKGYYAKDRE